MSTEANRKASLNWYYRKKQEDPEFLRKRRESVDREKENAKERERYRKRKETNPDWWEKRKAQQRRNPNRNVLNERWRKNKRATDSEWKQKQNETHKRYVSERRKVDLAFDEALKAYGRKHRAKRLEWYYRLKASLNCSLCGEDHPATLDFHHRDKTIKKFTISAAVFNKSYAIEAIYKELEKCDPICSNCHRKLHSDVEWELFK